MLSIDGTELSISDAVEFILDNRKYLTEQDLAQLKPLFKEEIVEQEQQGNVDNLDLLEEVNQQMAMIRTLRKKYLQQADSASAKDLKDLISTTTSLFSMLTKLHDDILNQDRLRRIEVATLKAIDTLPAEVKELFFIELENQLQE